MSNTNSQPPPTSSSKGGNISLKEEGFNPVDYLNQNFPTDESLDNLEGFVKTVSDQIAILDHDMGTAAKYQAVSADVSTPLELIESAKTSVSDLFDKMSEIAVKAAASETMVQLLCADIQRLDYAKRNLEHSFHTMKRLQILLNAVAQLEIVVADKDHGSCASLVEAINGTMPHFVKYTQVPLVVDLQTKIAKMTNELKMQMHRVFREMSQMMEAGVDIESAAPQADGKPRSVKSFANACSLVDKLGPDFMAEIVGEFVGMQLISYDTLFGFENKQHCGLDQVDRRWAWLKRIYKSFDVKFAAVFPDHWKLSIRLCTAFYDKTVVHLNSVLLDNEAKRTDALVEVPTLLKAVQSCMRFEMEMSSKFEIHKVDESMNSNVVINVNKYIYNNNNNNNNTNNGNGNGNGVNESGSTSPRSSKADVESPFLVEDIVLVAKKKLPKGISQIFDRFLGPYVLFERKNLEDLLTKLRQEEDKTSGSHDNVYDSSTSMFVYIRNSIKRCTSFATGQTFLSLCKEFKTCMQNYADMMRSTKCPAPAPGTKTVAYEVNLCYVINTAEYCAEVVPGIEQTIKHKLIPELIDVFDMSSEVDVFSDLVAYSLKCLVSSVMSRLEPVFKSMNQIQFGSMEHSPESESEFSRLWQLPLAEVLKEVYLSLTVAYYNNFCLKLSTEIINVYKEVIMKQKKIGEMGAQQLLLDTYTLKQILLKLHQFGGPESSPSSITAPTMYTKFVNQRIGQIEIILKLISTPESHLIERFQTLWPEGTQGDLQMIINLRGLKKSNQLGNIEALKQSMDSMSLSSAQASMSSLSSSLSSSARNAIDNFKMLGKN